MWIARFKLKDDEDIFSPLTFKHKVDFYASPYTHFQKNKRIHLLVGGIIAGSPENKNRFIKELKNDKRVANLEISRDFVLVHAIHPIERETLKEITTFYNPEYLLVKPVHAASDGWEYWEVACLDRNELNKMVTAAKKHYHGKLFSIKEEKIKSVSTLAIAPDLTEKQLGALQTALKEGYYDYPRKLTLPVLAKMSKISYSTFQEHLSKAESKVLSYFYKYR